MKRILLFGLSITAFTFLDASLHKALRATVPLAAVAVTGFQIKSAYDAHNSSNDPIVNDTSLKIFGEETQKALRGYYKAIYTCEKPLYFGVANREVNAFASNQAGINYIFFGYGFLPQFTFSKPPKPTENESEEDFDLRYSDYVKIKNEEHQRYDEFLHNPPMQEFKKRLEAITLIAKHEMGHLICNHAQKQINNQAQLAGEMAILSTLLNGYFVKSSFAKNSTKLALACTIAASISCIPFSYVYSLYKQNKLARLCECEADDFAIKNAESKEELIQAQALFKEVSKAETEKEASLFERFYHTYMGTHPSVSSRIEKIQKAIDNWQK